MTQQDTSDAKMAEQDDSILVGLLRPVVFSFPAVAVAGEQLVQPVPYPLGFLTHSGGSEAVVFPPVFPVVKPLVRRPVLRQPVPCDTRFILPRAENLRGEFPQPWENFRLPPQLFQRGLGGIPRPPFGGAVKRLHIQFAQTVGQQLRFYPAGLGQGVDGIVRVAVAHN